jgi:hypothetical protein
LPHGNVKIIEASMSVRFFSGLLLAIK